MLRNIPIVTRNLLLLNVVAFLATVVAGTNASGDYVLNELLGLHFFMASDFHVYQLFTYMFMHGNFEHILFNMFALWMFGCVVERVWGPQKFLFYYIVCGLGAGLFQELAQFVQFYMLASDQVPGFNFSMLSAVANNSSALLNAWTTVGASGAIYGILLAFGMIFPNDRIFIFPIPIPIKAKYLVIGYAAIELFSALSTTNDGVAHVAHLGGMVFGFFLIRYWLKQMDGGYGSDATAEAFNKMRNMFAGKRQRNTRFTYTRYDHSTQDESTTAECTPNWDDEARKKANQQKIDAILDKIRKSGYDSLTAEEKRALFDQNR